MANMMVLIKPVALKKLFYKVQQDLDQTIISKWGAKLSPLHGSNNGNPTWGIEPEFTCINILPLISIL